MNLATLRKTRLYTDSSSPIGPTLQSTITRPESSTFDSSCPRNFFMFLWLLLLLLLLWLLAQNSLSLVTLVLQNRPCGKHHPHTNTHTPHHTFINVPSPSQHSTRSHQEWRPLTAPTTIRHPSSTARGQVNLSGPVIGTTKRVWYPK